MDSDIEDELSSALNSAAEHLIRLLTGRSLYLAASESCTGGLVAEALTRVSGASSCFWGSFVTYTSRAKIQMLGVGEHTLNTYGAVSKQTAMAMVAGTLEKSGVDAAISVTGLAGPAGDGSALPVGTVWIAVACRSGRTERMPGTEQAIAREFHFSGSRNEVRLQAAREAIIQITELIQ